MPLSMPTRPGFAAARFGLETNTQTFTSPLTRATQRLVLAGSRWTATYTLPVMKRDQMAAWQAFLLSLEGGANTFSAYDPDAITPRGAWSGSPLVNGGGQTGSTLNIDNCTANVSGWGRAGDYFYFGELKMLTQDVNTNGSGQAALNFKPAIRTSPADNTPITFTQASCTMVLADDSQSMWQSGNRLGVYEGLSFSAYEVFA
jgi:hypothetical protein